MNNRFNYTNPNSNSNQQNSQFNQAHQDKIKQNNKNNQDQDEYAKYESQQFETQSNTSKLDFSKLSQTIIKKFRLFFNKNKDKVENINENRLKNKNNQNSRFNHTDFKNINSNNQNKNINSDNQNDNLNNQNNNDNLNYQNNNINQNTQNSNDNLDNQNNNDYQEYSQQNSRSNQDYLNNINQPIQHKRNYKNILIQLSILGIIGYGGYYGYNHLIKPNMNNDKDSSAVINSDNLSNSNIYKYPSEKGKSYPSVYQVTQVNVDLAKQRLYLMHGKSILYTMLISSGMHNTTPKGNFQIGAQQGKKVYDKQFQRGMNYWQTYNEDGKYNFSTLWTNKDGSYRVPKENVLGVKPSTDNGNIQLTTPDAKYIYNLVIGTPVNIY